MSVTRQEVEQELERTSASIAGSISRIRKDLSLPTEPVKSAVREHPLGTILGTIAIGLAVGWLVTGRRTETKRGEGSKALPGGDFDAAEFLHLVRMARASGLSEEEAVARALRVTSSLPASTGTRPRATLSQRLGDHLVDMAEALVKTGLRVVIREGAAWLAETVRRDKGRSQE